MKTLSVLVWTEGLNAYKYVRFQTKPLRVSLVWTGPYSFCHAHWQVIIAAQGFQAMITGCVLANVGPLVFNYNNFGSRHKSSEVWTRSLPLVRQLIYALGLPADQWFFERKTSSTGFQGTDPKFEHLLLRLLTRTCLIRKKVSENQISNIK